MSTGMKRLFPDGSLRNVLTFEQLQGAWLIEMAELSGLRKADIEAIKHFISKQEDRKG
jgi:predicted P-loop ATPase